MPVGEKIRSIDERPKSTGIVSEILVGTLVDSKNEFLSHPCDVVLHVMERTTDGDINPYKVSVCTGVGTWVMAYGAIFENLTEVMSLKYQELRHDEMQDMLKKFKDSKKLLEIGVKTGIF